MFRRLYLERTAGIELRPDLLFAFQSFFSANDRADQFQFQLCIWSYSFLVKSAMSPLDPEAATTPRPNKTNDHNIPQSLQPAATSTPPPFYQRRSSYSAKRVRNQDDRFLLPPCKTPAKAELEPVETFVESAIASQQQQSYRSIIDCLRKRNDANMLYRLLIVLRTNGTTLHQLITFPKQHAQLLHTIFRLDPFVVPPKMANDEGFHQLVDSFALADAHLHFVVAIVSANSTFLQPALNALWKMLVVNSQTDEQKMEERSRRLHAALATLFRLVPKGTTDLFPIISSNFPFRTRGDLVDYAKTCFQVLEYAPTLEPQMLELLIDKALEIDVEIRIKDGGNVEIDEEKFVKPDDDDAIFELELDDEPKTPKRADPKQVVEQKIDEMADKVRFWISSQIFIQNAALTVSFSSLVGFHYASVVSTCRSAS